MKILGLPNGKNINILTESEIIEKGKERHAFFTDPNKCSNWDEYITEYYERLLKEPIPYKLFRLNELFQYSLNFVGCEITEDQYFDRLNQLPPIPFEYDIYKGYIVPEEITENRFEHIFKHNNKFYCVIATKGLK